MKIFSLSCLLFSLFFLNCKTAPPKLSVAVPDWAKDAIWYQIFPERFCNGDTTNDPMFRDTFGSWPHDTLSPWQKSPWTADWYRLQPWETANGKDFNYNAGCRRFGGDLQGIIDKLDYLQELGVNAIYLNPIFEAPTMHKYDGVRHHHIDNNFGPDPARDRAIWEKESFADPTTWQWTTADSLFLKLIAEVHRREMRIIIDGVFNHIGVTNPAFQEVMKNGKQSPYAEWVIVKSWDEPSTPENEFDYQGWFGVKDLPEIRREGDDLAPGPKAYFKAIVQRWMDPNRDGNPADGIDGWRLDVAELVPKGFWRDFRKWVREINPNAYLTGEVWWEDYRNNQMFNAAPWLQGDIFDAVMNYRVADAVLKYFVDTQDAFDAKQLNQRLQKLRDEYPAEVNYVLMNLMDSHDTERLGSMVVNPNRMIDHASSASSKEFDFDVRKPNAAEMQNQKLIIAFQMLYLGAPMIYYGSEAGMWGADDPDERKPMVWPDLVYEPEKSHPLGKPRPKDVVAFDRELFNYYKTFTAIRRENSAIRRGGYQYVEVSQSPEVYAFVRQNQTKQLLSVFNRSAAAQEIVLPENYSRPQVIYGETNLTDDKRWLAGKSVAVFLRADQ